MRDVFVWAYERSCQQYVAVKSQLVPPDTFRLRYRAALAETVRAIVRGGQPTTLEAIRPLVPASVVPEDREAFAKLVLEEFKTMHVGNAVRFGLRPLEFEGGKALIAVVGLGANIADALVHDTLWQYRRILCRCSP